MITDEMKETYNYVPAKPWARSMCMAMIGSGAMVAPAFDHADPRAWHWLRWFTWAAVLILMLPAGAVALALLWPR